MLLLFWLVFLFVLGAGVGSFLNVCIYRIPYEKSILWPLGSRCGHCFQPIRWYHNLPLVSYWWLRGRCRLCGTKFSMRYFGVELLTGAGFVALFYLEVVLNVHDLPALKPQGGVNVIAMGLIPIEGWILFGYHAVLLCFLIVASFIDIDLLEIPLPVTATGLVLGLAGGALFWRVLPAKAIAGANLRLTSGVYPWPVWDQLPDWLPPESWLTGLATGLAGMLAGTVMLRAVRFVFGVGRGIEGMGVGDADLMMMAGSFLGWQPIVLAFFAGVLPGLVFGVGQLVIRGNQELPFGPSLGIGILLTLLGWHWIGPSVLPLFDPLVDLFFAVAGVFFLLIAALLLRVIRR